MAAHPLIEFVVAVHTESRPIRRAVESCITGAPAGSVRVLVVAHEISAASVEAHLDGLPPESYRVLPFSDGTPSPAGPFNFGLSQVDADYVAIFGSDDYFSEGFTAAAVDQLRRRSPDVLIYPVRGQTGKLSEAPLTRLGRQRGLRPQRDRLLYRTAPLALISRDVLRRAPVLMSPGHRTGEDLAFSFWLWTIDGVIDYDKSLPTYIVTDDVVDRVTAVQYPWGELLSPMFELLALDWATARPLAARRALAIKCTRVSILSPLRRAARSPADSVDDARALAEIVRQLRIFAPGFERYLSISEAAALGALTRDAGSQNVTQARRALANNSMMKTRIAKNPFYSFAPEGPSGRLVDYALAKLRSQSDGVTAGERQETGPALSPSQQRDSDSS